MVGRKGKKSLSLEKWQESITGTDHNGFPGAKREAGLLRNPHPPNPGTQHLSKTIVGPECHRAASQSQASKHRGISNRNPQWALARGGIETLSEALASREIKLRVQEYH